MSDRRFRFLEEPPQVAIRRNAQATEPPGEIPTRLRLKLALLDIGGRIVGQPGPTITIPIAKLREWQEAIRIALWEQTR